MAAQPPASLSLTWTLSHVSITKGVPMATQRAIDEADIRRRIDNCAEALHAMDLGGVMSIYAPDIVSFDIVPPLRHVGVEAKRKQWADAFAMYQAPLGYE